LRYTKVKEFAPAGYHWHLANDGIYGELGWAIKDGANENLLNYLVPQTDKAWAKGKGARKARAEPVLISKVRNTKIVMIFAEMVISIPGIDGQ
jgi:hypothetical protein